MHTHRSKRMDYGERRNNNVTGNEKNRETDRGRGERRERHGEHADERERDYFCCLQVTSLKACQTARSCLATFERLERVPRCSVWLAVSHVITQAGSIRDRNEARRGKSGLYSFHPDSPFTLKADSGRILNPIFISYVMSLDITMQIHKGIHPSLPFALTGEDACKGKRELNSPGCSPSKPTSTSQLGSLKSLHEAFPLYTFLAMWIPKAVACVPLRTSVSRAFRRKKLKRVHVIPSLKV